MSKICHNFTMKQINNEYGYQDLRFQLPYSRDSH
jgi:hypothetical protein